MEELYRTRPLSVEELGVAVDDLRGNPRSVLLHDLAARAREPALELALEAGAVQEPEAALALRLPEPDFPLVLHPRLVEVDALARELSRLDVALVAVSVGEVVDALSLGLAVDERRLDTIAILRVVAAASLQAPGVHLAFVAIAAREAIDPDALGLAVLERAVEDVAVLRRIAAAAADDAEPHLSFVRVAVRELVLAAAVGTVVREAPLVAVAVLPDVRSFSLLEALVEFALVTERLRDVFALALKARASHRAAIDRSVGEGEFADPGRDLASGNGIGLGRRRIRKRRRYGRHPGLRSGLCRGLRRRRNRGCDRGGDCRLLRTGIFRGLLGALLGFDSRSRRRGLGLRVARDGRRLGGGHARGLHQRVELVFRERREAAARILVEIRADVLGTRRIANAHPELALDLQRHVGARARRRLGGPRAAARREREIALERRRVPRRLQLSRLALDAFAHALEHDLDGKVGDLDVLQDVLGVDAVAAEAVRGDRSRRGRVGDQRPRRRAHLRQARARQLEA